MEVSALDLFIFFVFYNTGIVLSGHIDSRQRATTCPSLGSNLKQGEINEQDFVNIKYLMTKNTQYRIPAFIDNNGPTLQQR